MTPYPPLSTTPPYALASRDALEAAHTALREAVLAYADSNNDDLLRRIVMRSGAWPRADGRMCCSCCGRGTVR